MIMNRTDLEMIPRLIVILANPGAASEIEALFARGAMNERKRDYLLLLARATQDFLSGSGIEYKTNGGDHA